MKLWVMWIKLLNINEIMTPDLWGALLLIYRKAWNNVDIKINECFFFLG